MDFADADAEKKCQSGDCERQPVARVGTYIEDELRASVD